MSMCWLGYAILGMLTLDICSLLPLKANCVYVLPWDLILRKRSCLYLICIYHDVLWTVIRLQNSLVLNGDIQGSLKKFSFLFGQAEMVFVIVWFLDHFTLKPVPSVNGVWIIAFVSHHHAWVTRSKTLLMFFQLFILTSNNV